VTDVHPVSSPAVEACSAAGLRRLNVVVGCAHAVQAIALLMLAGEASLPVTASFLAGPPGTGDYALRWDRAAPAAFGSSAAYTASRTASTRSKRARPPHAYG
jgi:Heliorhodopsin